MTNFAQLNRRLLAGVMMATMTLATAAVIPGATNAQQARPRPNADMELSVGRGRLINLPAPMADVFVANNAVADVQVRSSTQLYIFGKAPGETSIYATDAAGRVVYSVVARVGNNIETIDQMLALAMPDAQIQVNTMNGFVLLTGTVRAPEDAAEADRLVEAFVGEGTRVISRLQTATPLQVNLQVKIAEVNRSIIRNLGGQLATQDESSGLTFGAFRGREGAVGFERQEAPTGDFPALGGNPVRYDPVTGRPLVETGRTELDPRRIIRPLADAATFALGGRAFGLNILAALDAAERTGMVTTLAQPNLTTVSGETADFLAGGEYPVPVPDPQSGSIVIQYRKFGVSLAYTPTVLSNGRISLRVRPEVSELSAEGAIRLQGIEIPALSIRRAETTVELGSGESFMIAGLMTNRTSAAIDRTPGVGDVPILGQLFRSENFRRGDTELVIVVTPYLVRPVTADQIVLPTDGYRNPTDLQRFLLNGVADGEDGARRPTPTLRTEGESDPDAAPARPGPVGLPPAGSSSPRSRSSSRDDRRSPLASPGFSAGGN